MIDVISSGIQSSLQDLGRFGYRKFGVPTSGAMDIIAATQANQIIGNSLENAVLEFALQGPILKFNTQSVICISGASFSPILNNKKIPLNTAIAVQVNDILRIGTCQQNVYGYLAILGGFRSKETMGSLSYYPNICDTSLISKENQLTTNKTNNLSHFKQLASIRLENNYLQNEQINVLKGPEFDFLPPTTQTTLLETKMVLSKQISRMGYQLKTLPDTSAKEIITSPVQPGTVQLTPSGRLIVLMKDAQTTGGYARVLQLTNESLAILAQKRATQSFQFKLIS